MSWAPQIGVSTQRGFDSFSSMLAAPTLADDPDGFTYIDKSTGIHYLTSGGTLIPLGGVPDAGYQGAVIGQQTFDVGSGARVVLGTLGNFDQLGTRTRERPGPQFSYSDGVVTIGPAGRGEMRVDMIFSVTAAPRTWAVDVERNTTSPGPLWNLWATIFSKTVAAGNVDATVGHEVEREINEIPSPLDQFRLVIYHDGGASQDITVKGLRWTIAVTP